MKLLQSTFATRIDTVPGQKPVGCIFPAGTRYKLVEQRTDALGYHWQIIEVDGELYEIAD